MAEGPITSHPVRVKIGFSAGVYRAVLTVIRSGSRLMWNVAAGTSRAFALVSGSRLAILVRATAPKSFSVGSGSRLTFQKSAATSKAAAVRSGSRLTLVGQRTGYQEFASNGDRIVTSDGDTIAVVQFSS